VETEAQLTDWRLATRQFAQTYTIFEGTSEIQRLVIARAISGVHIP
jgi:alkylation response protein AidB-like acyl-CoA dehydrogenase